MREREADTLLRFARAARPLAATAVAIAAEAGGDRREQADRLVRHWRNELVVLAALPGIGGRFAQPAREVLAGTVQGLLVVSLAQLCEVSDEYEQVRLLATLVLREQLPAGWAPTTDPSAAPVAVDPDPATEEGRVWRLIAQQVPRKIFALARELWTIRQLTDDREEGRLWHRALGGLPAVGVVGAAFGERHAIAEVAERAYAALGLTQLTLPEPSLADKLADRYNQWRRTRH
ncbi:MAG: hypothetical protein IRZ08_04755 [Frankia sp.]|nr:hypothetical protein [Frankia sp.]